MLTHKTEYNSVLNDKGLDFTEYDSTDRKSNNAKSVSHKLHEHRKQFSP